MSEEVTTTEVKKVKKVKKKTKVQVEVDVDESRRDSQLQNAEERNEVNYIWQNSFKQIKFSLPPLKFLR